VALYDRVAGLPLEIEGLELERASLAVSPEFERVTTTVILRGGRAPDGTALAGRGEDVTYTSGDHAPDRLARPELVGRWTIGSLASRLDREELFPGGGPAMPASRDYRRWAFESAALDLALLQAGRSLEETLETESRPVRFVSSTRSDALGDWLALYPALRFKLDARPEWSDEYAAGLAARGNVDVVDLKGAYHGTPVDNPPDAALYRRVAELLPTVWIEDPALTPETDAVLEPHRDRVTWDAPIHSWADVEALPFAPRCLNSKPSRFGSLERLFEFYDRCREHRIALYGGGQFELGIGRAQIQLLAGLFHPDAPNDVAPGGYNDRVPRAGLPVSPLGLRPARAGFRPAEAA
jgi:hypothetical protein